MTATSSKQRRKRKRGGGGGAPPSVPAQAVDDGRCNPASPSFDWPSRGIRPFRSRFDIEERIAYGSYKEVFLAQDKGTGNDVALCIYVESVAESERFLQRHLQTMYAVRHPAVMRVVDGGIALDGEGKPHAYVTADLIRQSVTAGHAVLQAGGALMTPRVLRYCHDVLAGLQAFHNSGLVHGSPHGNNTLIDADGAAVLVDFDWTMPVGETRIRANELVTIVGFNQTTPEQLRGLPHDERSDLYVAGLGMFHVACGRLPYSDTTYGTMDGVDGLRFIDRLDRLPATPRSINPNLPEQLSDLLLSLLTPNPANRPHSAAAALTELKRIAFPFPGREASIAVRKDT